MATRHYLRDLTAPTSPTAGEKSTAMPAAGTATANNASGTQETRSLSLTKSTGAQTTHAIVTDATTSLREMYMGRFSSAAWTGAETVTAQTWTIALAALMGTSTVAVTHTALSLYVWRPGTSSVVGYIYDSATALGNTWSQSGSSSEQGRLTTFAGAAISVQAGDILVLEVWANIQQTMATAYTKNIYYDGATDPTEGTATTDAASYLETPQTLTFGGGGGAQASDDVLIRLGPLTTLTDHSGLVTPLFTAPGGGSPASSGGTYYQMMQQWFEAA